MQGTDRPSQTTHEGVDPGCEAPSAAAAASAPQPTSPGTAAAAERLTTAARCQGDRVSGRRLLQLAAVFLKLGAISFGGTLAAIGLMEREVVQRRKWITLPHFLDMLALTNLVPGPNAAEMAVHIGFVHAHWPGLAVAGVAFILPSFVIAMSLGAAYAHFGALPQVAMLLYGVKPVTVAIVLSTTYRLGRSVLTDKRAVGLAAACLAACVLGVDETSVLLGSGVAAVLLYSVLPSISAGAMSLVPLALALPAAASVLDDRLLRVGLFFLRAGALLFGSGMVLFAFVQRDIVTRYGWLTQHQLLDAIAVGQMVPGPASAAATVIGYLVAGWPGGVLATIGIFLPSFAIVAVTGPWLPRLRQSPVACAFLRGVNAAVVALILSVGVNLLRAAVVDVFTAVLLTLALAALLFLEANPVWLLLGGLLVAVIRYLVCVL